MNDSRIGLVVSAHRRQADVDRIAAATGLMLIDDDQPLPDMRAVVFDIDLADMDAVSALRKRTRGAQIGARIFFISDRSDVRRARADQVQAASLGATSLLPRPMSVARINQHLAAEGLRDEDATLPETEAIATASVRACFDGMSAVFDDYSAGHQLDRTTLYAMAADAMSGLEQAGASQWLKVVRDHHEGTFQHCLLVAGAAAAYGLRPDWGHKLRTDLVVAAILHDLGKLDVPTAILEKPSKLTPDEMALVRRHPLSARDYLMRNGGIDPDILDAVTHHHEFLDGSGYPHGLKGNAISVLTRALTCCDIFAALTEQRAYKDAITPRIAALLLRDLAEEGKLDPVHVRHLVSGLGIAVPKGL